MPAASETISSASSAASVAAAATATGAATAGTVNTHVVQVGGPNGSTVFMPNNVQAQPGDLVQFQFNAKNHSVVQSTFDQPCIPIQNVMANKTDAFFSGFMPNNRTFGTVSTAGLLTYTIRVMDAKPIWFYCSQAKHCQAGMVGAVNAATTGNKTMQAFAALAAQASENLTPGQAAGAASPSGATPGVAESSGAAGGGAAATGTGSVATGSSSNSPAQQTTNAAPGRSATDSLLGLGVAGLAAFLAL
ncbi:Cupredoxin [Lophiotrema nucula]|uniref:Cupredoxin n=1 Tax=Lophiotrema nucula TaxID=690887 RepID=A0A6A5ZK11_9PLEO|nr:Cupredoxin [Lophiotrema nucula]